MRPQRAVDVRVDAAHHVRRRGEAVLHRRLHLGQPVGAVGEVELDGALRVVEDRTVPGQHGVDAVVDRERAQPPQ